MSIQNTNIIFSKENGFEFCVGKHNESTVIWVKFAYDKSKIESLKQLHGKWSASQKCWYVPNTAYFRGLFQLPISVVSKKVLLKISAVNKPALQQMQEELLLKSYSPSTIKIYLLEFAQFLYVLKNVAATSLTYKKLRSYFLYCVTELKISDNHLHSRINAIKFYYEQVLKKEKFMIEIPRPKKPSILPKAFSQKDIEKIFNVVTNEKHLLMLKLCYGMGLRVSEVVALKLADIDSKRMQVLLQAGKGKKDRYVNLPQTVLKDLKNYYKKYKPAKYLFEGQYGGFYTTRSLQTVFKKAIIKAGIKKAVGIHGLRHSYATHLLDYGTDVVFIQKLLGHNDIKTTQRYLAVTNKTLKNIVSPLDRLL